MPKKSSRWEVLRRYRQRSISNETRIDCYLSLYRIPKTGRNDDFGLTEVAVPFNRGPNPLTGAATVTYA